MSDYLFKDRDGQTPLPPELQKGLRPKHIQTIGELDEYEERNIAEGLIWLERQSDPGLTHTFWLKLHEKLLGDVWEWAGKIRTHELQNPEFLAVRHLWTGLRQLEGDLAYWLRERNLPVEKIAALFHERIETIHPFANGNGRFGRILIEHFCRRQGWPVPTWGARWKPAPPERRRRYISALTQARQTQDHSALAEFMYC